MRAHRMRAAVGGGSAFPIVQNERESTSFTSGTSFSVLMPTGIVAGNLLLMIVRYLQAPTAVAVPAGWSDAGSYIPGGTYSMAIFMKLAVGGEGTASVTTTAATTNKTATVLRISNFYGTLASGVDAFYAISTTAAPDPPSLSPTWGAAKNLWLGVCMAANTAGITYPSGYSDYQYSSGADAPRVAIAGRNLETATENPPAFSLTSGVSSIAFTYAIRGT